MTRPNLRTPISYYGGKQQMLQHILPLIPAHDIYTEAFFGGGALFFAKEPSRAEVINDLNGEVINFYRTIQTNFAKLNKLIQATLHSRELYADAMVIYNSPHLFDEVRRAWAFWILTNQGYVSKIGSWGYDRDGDSMVKKLKGKKLLFNDDLKERLERTQIECNKGVKVIASRDTPKTFHFVDPPYAGTNLGHYKGYTLADDDELLACLVKVQGKFILCNYQSQRLDMYAADHGWHVRYYNKQLSASTNKSKKKCEMLMANFPI